MVRLRIEPWIKGVPDLENEILLHNRVLYFYRIWGNFFFKFCQLWDNNWKFFSILGPFACTSIVAQDSKGNIFHGRNLDYDMGSLLKNITVIVDFVRNDTVSTVDKYWKNEKKSYIFKKSCQRDPIMMNCEHWRSFHGLKLAYFRFVRSLLPWIRVRESVSKFVNTRNRFS